jgi:ppGpp synthetase/RelA/SpoT-type nucleotidyltranferase
MAGDIDEYIKDEEEFLRRHWDGADRQTVLSELSLWIDWELKPVSTEIISIFNEIGKDFHDRTVEDLRSHWRGYEDRFVVELDTSNVIKTPERILEKFVRSWREENKSEAPNLNRLNYKTTLSDAVRLRYEVNFLEDGEKLFQLILHQAKYPASKLYQKLELQNNKCNVHESLNTRIKGERSWKLFFVHRGTDYKIELQICTQLQVSWDKKDHFLIYERDREGLTVQPGDIILMKHVSDQLYVVDRQLDEFRRKIQDELRNQGA